MNSIKSINPNFKKVVISLTSPEDVLSRSCGEVLKSDTKDHRTGKSKPGGLFCQVVFGPEESWKCYCGTYKNMKYSNTKCPLCGVLIGDRNLRRQRMGHFKLFVPVVNTLFFRYHPNVIASLLGVSAKKLENVIYYSSYIVIQPGSKAKEGITKMDFLTPKEYEKHIRSPFEEKNSKLPNSSPDKFIAKMGGEAIHMLLKEIDIGKLAVFLRNKIKTETSQQRCSDLIKRLGVVESFRKSIKSGVTNKPEWMVFEYLPVMSPGYRPSIVLSNGRFATTDLTELYRKLIVCNERLRKLKEIGAPLLIVIGEKRILQERVDALIDNSPRMNTSTTENGRELKSLAHHLKGKVGLFRFNLLGKRVDFSTRSVIVVGPHLKLDECGIPKEMALVMFSVFVIQRLKTRGTIKTFKEGRQLLEKKPPVVWQVLENVVREHPVMLNRAPTLHRLGIQAFYPKLIEGNAIQLHPLVCAAFNADFDGDQMAVHLPLSIESIAEARLLMLSTNNMLNPANGEPIMIPSKDMVLGLYYATVGFKSTPEKPIPGEGMCFSSPSEVIIAINNNKISKHAHIKVRLRNGDNEIKVIDTTGGRIMFNQYMPEGVPFANECINSKKIRNMVADVYKKVGKKRTALFLDDVKQFGFQQAYEGGLTFGLDDMIIPPGKEEMIQEAEKEVAKINENYYEGFITDTERYNQVIDVWSKFFVKMRDILLKGLEESKQFNTLFAMMDSGARGSQDQIKQLCSGRGLMSKPQKTSSTKGSIIEQPILHSFREGLSAIEYFVTLHGARRGLIATALKVADSGYFNRRFIDVVQNVVIAEKDCHTLRSRTVTVIYKNGRVNMFIGVQILGRIIARDIVNPKDKSVIIGQGTMVDSAVAKKIDNLGIQSVQVRSPIYCEAKIGICAKCYGLNLGTQKLAVIGDVVGNIAAQSISEPGTQLTLRTFHHGGVFSGNVVDDAVKALEDGTLQLINLKTVELGKKHIVINRESELKVIGTKAQTEIQSYIIPYGATLLVNKEGKVNKGQLLFEWDPYKMPILATAGGRVHFEFIEEGITYKEEHNEQTGHIERIIIDSQDKQKVPHVIVDNGKGARSSYMIPAKAQLVVDEGDVIKAGTILAKSSRPRSRPQDIVGGLPRVIKLFEMQSSSSKAVMAPVDGQISIGMRKRNNIEVSITSRDGKKYSYKVPITRQLLVQEGDYVKAGVLLSDGVLVAEDILHIKGLDAFCNHILEKVQEVYRLQGVEINDKHIEVVLRQMLQKVKVIDAGDTGLIPNKLVNKTIFNKENQQLHNKRIILDAGDTPFQLGDLVNVHQLEVENKAMKNRGLKTAESRVIQPAKAKFVAQGITASAVGATSFLASGSFQETMKTFVKSAISGTVDNLTGIKENTLVGKLIPAGTGMQRYRSIRVTSKEVEKSLLDEKIER